MDLLPGNHITDAYLFKQNKTFRESIYPLTFRFISTLGLCINGALQMILFYCTELYYYSQKIKLPST